MKIHVEIDPQTSKVTAIATGSTEVKATDLTKQISKEALELAAEDMRVSTSCFLISEYDFFYVVGENNVQKNASERYGSSTKKDLSKYNEGMLLV